MAAFVQIGSAGGLTSGGATASVLSSNVAANDSVVLGVLVQSG